jgi:hypothetical protein
MNASSRLASTISTSECRLGVVGHVHAAFRIRPGVDIGVEASFNSVNAVTAADTGTVAKRMDIAEGACCRIRTDQALSARPRSIHGSSVVVSARASWVATQSPTWQDNSSSSVQTNHSTRRSTDVRSSSRLLPGAFAILTAPSRRAPITASCRTTAGAAIVRLIGADGALPSDEPSFTKSTLHRQFRQVCKPNRQSTVRSVHRSAPDSPRIACAFVPPPCSSNPTLYWSIPGTRFHHADSPRRT